MFGLHRRGLRARTPNCARPFKRSADADIEYLHVMGISNASYWSRRAARMRPRAEHVADLDQRVGMLETAQHYETLAHYSRETTPSEAIEEKAGPNPRAGRVSI